jgi:hypothetical protein
MRRLCFVLFSLVAPLASAQRVPAVAVNVIIRSDAIRGLVNVPDAQRLAAERIVTSIRRSQDFSFVSWIENDRAANPAARFTVTLYEEQRRGLPSIHHIAYERVIYAPDVRVPRLELAYAAGKSYFTTREERAKLGKKESLANAIAAIVAGHLTQYHDLFLKQFLYKVPLSRTDPRFDKNDSVMIIVPWDEMGAKEYSFLEIQIVGKPRTKKGSFTVSDIFACSDCNEFTARANVKNISAPGFVTTRDELKKVIDDGLTSSVVYMATYVPNYESTITEYDIGH